MDRHWTVGYDNDTGPNDNGFWEWYQVGPCRIDIPRDKEGADQARADAHLVAAAPDLYVALKAWRDYEDGPSLMSWHQVSKIVDEALAKAEASRG